MRVRNSSILTEDESLNCFLPLISRLSVRINDKEFINAQQKEVSLHAHLLKTLKHLEFKFTDKSRVCASKVLNSFQLLENLYSLTFLEVQDNVGEQIFNFLNSLNKDSLRVLVFNCNDAFSFIYQMSFPKLNTLITRCDIRPQEVELFINRIKHFLLLNESVFTLIFDCYKCLDNVDFSVLFPNHNIFRKGK